MNFPSAAIEAYRPCPRIKGTLSTVSCKSSHHCHFDNMLYTNMAFRVSQIHDHSSNLLSRAIASSTSCAVQASA